ncbi:MAG: TOBE domain-containing protein [Caulobacterales bacterium]
MADDALNAEISLHRASARLGGARVELLAAIAELGSISAAAKRVGLSYKGAWDAVRAVNNIFDEPLVIAHAGGAHGGAAKLSERGAAVVEGFRRLEKQLGAALGRIQSDAGLMWSLGMRTSARNAFRGVVTAINEGPVSAEVTLRVGEGLDVVAVVTRHSLTDLELAVGRPAIALIKASFVILARGEGLKTSARNHFAGVVAARDDGTVTSEIILDLGGGKTLVATVTRESADELDLVPGVRATALVKAPHVILAVD